MHNRVSLIVIFTVSLLNIINAQFPVRDDCKWRKNFTNSDIQDLPHHKYTVLEDCLFYKLADNAEKLQGKTGALLLLPPSRHGRKVDRLELNIQEASLRQLWMNEVWKEMHLNGYFKMDWEDYRLKWDVKEWKVNSLKLKSFGHLWMPDINSEKYQTSMQAGDFTTYKEVTIGPTGNVSAYLDFRMQASCTIDYRNYPADNQHCCFTMRSALFAYMIRFNIISGAVNLDKLQTNWHIEKAELIKQESDEDDAQELRLCVTASRKSSTLALELSLPMVVAALLVLVAPLVGNFQHQAFVKLFAILLQFLCFQFLVEKTPQVGFGDSMPIIYKFYEFTLVMTLVSLLLTLLIWSLSRIDRRLPPPHSAKLFATTFNQKLCCIADPTAADNTDNGY